MHAHTHTYTQELVWTPAETVRKKQICEDQPSRDFATGHADGKGPPHQPGQALARK